MNTELEELLSDFEKLQTKYLDFGAGDTEPDWVFHSVIRKALLNKPVDFDNLDFELFDDKKGCSKATASLRIQAKKVYDFIRDKIKLSEVRELIDYAWRVDLTLDEVMGDYEYD